MKYKFRKLDFWEELKTAVGDIPVSVTDSGKEMLLDFGEAELALPQEIALKKLMLEKPMLRGKQAKFVEKGVAIKIEPEIDDLLKSKVEKIVLG